MHTKKASFPIPRELTFLTSGHKNFHVSISDLYLCDLNNPFVTGPPFFQKTVTFPSFPDKGLLKFCLVDLRLTLYTSNLWYDVGCASSYVFSLQSPSKTKNHESNSSCFLVFLCHEISLAVGYVKHTFNTCFILAVLLECKSAHFCVPSLGCLSKN